MFLEEGLVLRDFREVGQTRSESALPYARPPASLLGGFFGVFYSLRGCSHDVLSIIMMQLSTTASSIGEELATGELRVAGERDCSQGMSFQMPLSLI